MSIGPRPGGRFIGTHGGAYTYLGSSPGAAMRADSTAFGDGSGTITSFRVYSVGGTEGPIDMLVTF